MHKIITFSGCDNTGKTTHTRLLAEALPNSKRMKFPHPSHWSECIIRAVLSKEVFRIERTHTGDLFYDYKSAIPWQYLQAINRQAHQNVIKNGLRDHHWIMDRYDADAIAYGVAEGVSRDLLNKMLHYEIPSDLVIILDNPEPAKDERRIQDINDQDTALQRRVREVYLTLPREEPDRYALVNTYLADWIDAAARLWGITIIHWHICNLVENHLDLKMAPLSQRQIAEILHEGMATAGA